MFTAALLTSSTVTYNFCAYYIVSCSTDDSAFHVAGSVPAEEFTALSELLASAPPKVCFGHLGILQLGYAAAAALSGPSAARWTHLAELEQKILHLSANGESQFMQRSVQRN